MDNLQRNFGTVEISLIPEFLQNESQTFTKSFPPSRSRWSLEITFGRKIKPLHAVLYTSWKYLLGSNFC